LIAYGVVAGVIFLIYVVVAIFGEVQRKKGPAIYGRKLEMTNSPEEERSAYGYDQRSHGVVESGAEEEKTTYR
jgi:hypothetical protein